MYSLLLALIYLIFISLGLPDSLLGSAWPSMYGQLNVPVSFAGIISMIIAVNTVISSLQSDRLIKRIGIPKVTAVSVAMTAVAIFGFSTSTSFWTLCLWAIPYGLGAGSVDAALNNYVAMNYKSKHMSWLHCMWGVGAVMGPYIIGYALSSGSGWSIGYRWIGIIQIVLTAIIFMSLPLWKKNRPGTDETGCEKELIKGPITLRQAFHLQGAKEAMLAFFCYCALEQTAMLWASSYMVLHNGISMEMAASYASFLFIGITVGRAVNGFLMTTVRDTQMIRVGQALIALGIVAIVLPVGNVVMLCGFILIGLGCAPIYPCIIHSTPEHFGADKSQALIGIQMASAYVGALLMPPLFGIMANQISVALLPLYLFSILILMVAMHALMVKKTMKTQEKHHAQQHD